MLLKKFLEKLTSSSSSSSHSSSYTASSNSSASLDGEPNSSSHSKRTHSRTSTINNTYQTSNQPVRSLNTTKFLHTMNKSNMPINVRNNWDPNSENLDHRLGGVMFNLVDDDDSHNRKNSSNDNYNQNYYHNYRRQEFKNNNKKTGSLSIKQDVENDHHDDNRYEHTSQCGSLQSSFSGNINKLENDIEDLHLHHDHNTHLMFKNGNHSNKILNSLNEMRKLKQMCDVTLIAENNEITCHKAVLACKSPYFRAMFSNDLLESSSNQIEMKEVDSDSLKSLVDYIYTGELLITESNVQSLLITANLLNILNIKETCGQFIQSQIDVTNCLGICEFADYHSSCVLKKHAEAFIEQYFSEIVQKEEFLNLNVDQLIRLISKDHLAVHSEKIVYDCVFKWISHDHEKRVSHIAKLMENVRFCLLKHEDLVSISEDPLIKSNLLCMEFIAEALQYKMVKSNNADLEKFQADFSNKARIRPRIPLGLPKMMFIFGGQAPKAISKIDIYDFRSQDWCEHEDMPSKRCRAGCVYHDGLIYLIGGFNGQSRIRSVDIYCPQTENWSTGPDMLCRRGTLGVGILNDRVYAVGGFDGMAGLVSVECWSMKMNESWTMVAPLSMRRSSVGIAVINNYLYAIGGYCGLSRECLDSVERYDPFSDSWSPVAHMTIRRSGACVNVYDGKIYVVGGHDGPVVLKSVEMYDPVHNRWILISELNVARRNSGFVIHNGLFYIIGGDDGHDNLSSVEIYNPQRNVWSLLSSFLNEAKSYTSCIIIENYN